MEHEDPRAVEVECPQCGAKSKRVKAVLEICVTGCPECRCMWKHKYMLLKEYREAQEEKLNGKT